MFRCRSLFDLVFGGNKDPKFEEFLRSLEPIMEGEMTPDARAAAVAAMSGVVRPAGNTPSKPQTATSARPAARTPSKQQAKAGSPSQSVKPAGQQTVRSQPNTAEKGNSVEPRQEVIMRFDSLQIMGFHRKLEALLYDVSYRQGVTWLEQLCIGWTHLSYVVCPKELRQMAFELIQEAERTGNLALVASNALSVWPEEVFFGQFIDSGTIIK